jgi:aspartate kinase
MIVQKHGGTSVGSVSRIRRVSRRIADTVASGQQVVAVVSAMGHTTDHLISLAQRVAPQLPVRELDMLVANGETITAPLVAMCLQSQGVPALSLTGGQAGILTSRDHSRARIVDIRPERVRRALADGAVPVVAGFQGVTADGEITTLGRGGSDTTAVALAGALGADVCEILTDVDGVLTADPRVVPQARLLDRIAYEEMRELAMAGTQVLQPGAVELGSHYGVPIHVRSSFHRRRGTMIVASVPADGQAVRGIAYEREIGTLRVAGLPDRPGATHEIVELLAGAGISAEVLATSVNDLVVATGGNDLTPAQAAIQLAAASATAEVIAELGGLARISIVGRDLLATDSVMTLLGITLTAARIDFKVTSRTRTRITCLVPRADGPRAVQALHAACRLRQPIHARLSVPAS